MTLLAVLSGLRTKILKGLNATLTVLVCRKEMDAKGAL
jgi:hypothetical protein